MKQKYVIKKSDDNTNIFINEFVELTSNEFSLLSEQEYKATEINKARKTGSDDLIKVLRSPDFFPPMVTAERLAAAIEELMADRDKDDVEVILDDIRVMNELDVDVDELEDDADIDDLDDILTDDDDDMPEDDDEDD